MKDIDTGVINNEKSVEVSDKLNSLLSDLQIYYQNLRGFHWLVRGNQFFQLHAKYEELYNEAAEIIDETAERILMLGNFPYHTFEEYLEHASLKVEKNISDGNSGIELVVENMSHLLNRIREINLTASDNYDEGTASFTSDLISRFEKHLWMFTSYQN